MLKKFMVEFFTTTVKNIKFWIKEIIYKNDNNVSNLNNFIKNFSIKFNWYRYINKLKRILLTII